MRFGWAAGLALLWLAGCAAVQGPATTPPPEGGLAAAPPAPAATTRLEVVAPPELKTLLERYLDLGRVGTLAGGDAIDDSEWSRLIDVAPLQVRELMETEGYFEPQVTVTQEPPADGVQRHVRLEVEPGPRTNVSRVTLEVEGELERSAEVGDAYAKQVLADWRKGWALPAGAPFRNPAWNDAKASALARLRAAGFASAAWNGTGAEIDAAKREARLFLVVESGPLFRFGELKIEGLTRQNQQTVRNLAGFRDGTPISDTLLLDYQERLQKSGLYDSVTVTLDPDPERASIARIVVNLREAPLQVYTFGIGYSANTGPRASVEHVYRRVFGYDLTARNKVEVGQLRTAWDGEVSTHPGERQYRNLLGGAVERLETDSDVVLSQRLRVGRTQDTQRIERLYFVEAERSERTTLTIPSTRTAAVALSVNYHGIWRKVDSVLLPTDGYTLSVQSGVGRAHGSDSDSGPFARLYGRLTLYKPVGGSWYGVARVELGQVFKSDQVAVPESQLFRAGGDDSVRGYEYRTLGPIVDGAVAGGNSLITTSVELARPISAKLPTLWGAVFVDAGNAANDFNNFHFALGPGVGLRWRSPVGPLRLDWAWGRDERKGRLHFSVGIVF